MRFRIRFGPVYGEDRKKTFFAWLPVEIGSQIRWLETVTVLQVYNIRDNWENRKFVNK